MQIEIGMYLFEDSRQNLSKVVVNGFYTQSELTLDNLKDSNGEPVKYSGKINADLRNWATMHGIRCTHYKIKFDSDNNAMTNCNREIIIDFPVRKLETRFNVFMMPSGGEYEQIAYFDTSEQAKYFITTAGPQYPKSTVFKINEVYMIV